MSMEKYGIMADSIVCKKCKGTGRTHLGRAQWVWCHKCKGTGRESMKIDPVKEAAEIKKEIGDNNDNEQQN